MSDFAIQLDASSKLAVALADQAIGGDSIELAGIKVRIMGISYHTSGSINYATVNGREVEG
jgi:hypothetical protein